MDMNINEIKNGILFLCESGSKEHLEIPMTPIDTVNDLMAELGFAHLSGEGDSNGWEHDFWEYYRHPDYGKFCLSGSLWYGNFRIRKEKDE